MAGGRGVGIAVVVDLLLIFFTVVIVVVAIFVVVDKVVGLVLANLRVVVATVAFILPEDTVELPIEPGNSERKSVNNARRMTK